MNDREGSRSPISKNMSDRDLSPHKRDDSPRNHKGRSYSRSPSRSRKVYRDEHERDGRRDRERDDRRYRSQSRSSRSDRRYRSSKCSRSRSRSRSRGGGGGGGDGRGAGYGGGRRSHSHSPMSSRRRHTGTRDNPKPSRCLGVFGLSVYTTEDELHHIFSKYGPVERVQVVIDAKTGRSRGFSFVYFENTNEAKMAKEECNGIKINGKNIRVDYSITQRAHTPTPGIYMGKPTYVFNDRWDRRGRDRDRDSYSRSSRYRRSPSPYYRRSRRYERSRSRSYSQLVKEHQAKQSGRKEAQEIKRKEAVAAASNLTQALVDHLNVGVAQAYLNQKKLDAEAKQLHVSATTFSKQTQQWLALVDSFSSALKELGDVENWAKAIEDDVRTVAMALEIVYKDSQENQSQHSQQ